MTNARRWVLRLLAVGAIGATLTGPTPGNVQGCGQTAPIADAQMFCADKGRWTCRREVLGGRLTQEEADQQALMIEPTCSGFLWPDGCQPTESQAQACIDGLLRQPELLNIPTPELLRMYSDCNLCGSSPPPPHVCE